MPSPAGWRGNPFPWLDAVAAGTATSGRRAAYSVSDTGILVYRGGGSAGFQLSWLSRDGKAEVMTRTGADQRNGDRSISPDGRRVLLERQIAGNMDV